MPRCANRTQASRCLLCQSDCSVCRCAPPAWHSKPASTNPLQAGGSSQRHVVYGCVLDALDMVEPKQGDACRQATKVRRRSLE